MTKLLKIESEHWRLWLSPESGVQWQAGQVKRGADWLHIFPDCRPSGESEPRAGQDESGPLTAACFHMLPYSNRVRDARFQFGERTYQLEDVAKHAMHGALRKRAWRVQTQSNQVLQCEYETSRDGEVNWPWPLLARIRYEVRGRELKSEMVLTNQGTSSMPCGMGWHPYFVRQIEGASPTLTLPVTGVYPDTDGDCLPVGKAMDLPPSLDFRKARRLTPKPGIDCCLAGFSGTAQLLWPEADLSLTLEASSNCSHLVLYNPDKPHFAVEPVSNANDGFNLLTQGIDSGVQVLGPGESMTGWMTLRLGKALS
jgi:aldose 1-epimerase